MKDRLGEFAQPQKSKGQKRPRVSQKFPVIIPGHLVEIFALVKIFTSIGLIPNLKTEEGAAG